jgi:hypothetical protein
MAWTHEDRGVNGEPCTCGEGAIVRDYRAENVGVVGLELMKAEREAGSKEAYDRLFLPHNDDFKGPGDPDGTIGMRAWRDNHQPRPSNHAPRWPGTVEKLVH